MQGTCWNNSDINTVSKYLQPSVAPRECKPLEHLCGVKNVTYWANMESTIFFTDFIKFALCWEIVSDHVLKCKNKGEILPVLN
jgi:hypothetical protein